MKGKRFQLFAKKINNNESQISTAFIHFCMLKNKRDEMLWNFEPKRCIFSWLIFNLVSKPREYRCKPIKCLQFLDGWRYDEDQDNASGKTALFYD